MHTTVRRAPVAALALFVLAGCASTYQPTTVNNATLPESVRVPDGHRQTAWTVGKGEITYECRAKADAPGQHAWAFVTPVATLSDASGQTVGRYYGGPTWEGRDGSMVKGKQVGLAPAPAGNIAWQLVQATPSSGQGLFEGTSYIQRLNTRGGVAPQASCTASNQGQRMQVAYQADYVVYKPAR